MTDGDLPGLSAFVDKLKAMLVASVEEIATAEAGDRTDPGGDVDEDRDDRAVTEPDWRND